MKTNRMILNDTLIETIRSPRLGEEAERNGLTKPVELQSAASTSIHNRGVMDYLNRDISFLCADPKICMCSSTS